MPPSVEELYDAIGWYPQCSLDEIARLLDIGAGTDEPGVNTWQTDGEPLVEAIKKGRIDLLLDRGADINTVGGTWGCIGYGCGGWRR